MTKQIEINVYRDRGVWFGARWIDGEFDGVDALDIDDDATTFAAIEAAREMPLTAEGERTVRKVADIG